MKHIVLVLFIVASYAGIAQSNFSIAPLKKGDQFLKQTLTNATYFVQLGDDTLDIKTNLLVTKVYTVDDVSDDGYSFIVATEKIVDTINAMGNAAYYDSDMMQDSSSLIEKAIKKIIGSPAKIYVNKQGIIVSAEANDSIPYFTDSLAAFTGIEAEQYLKGSSIELIADFPLDILYKKGYSWIDSASIPGHKIVTTYGIDSNSNTSTTVQFASKLSKKYSNSNINGVLMVDNSSGLIMEKLTRSIAVGYQFLNGDIYLVEKRSAVSESCYIKSTDSKTQSLK